jgi:hypothetical protein
MHFMRCYKVKKSLHSQASLLQLEYGFLLSLLPHQYLLRVLSIASGTVIESADTDFWVYCYVLIYVWCWRSWWSQWLRNQMVGSHCHLRWRRCQSGNYWVTLKRVWQHPFDVCCLFSVPQELTWHLFAWPSKYLSGDFSANCINMLQLAIERFHVGQMHQLCLICSCAAIFCSQLLQIPWHVIIFCNFVFSFCITKGRKELNALIWVLTLMWIMKL